MIQEEHLSKLNNTGQNTSTQEGEKREREKGNKTRTKHRQDEWGRERIVDNLFKCIREQQIRTQHRTAKFYIYHAWARAWGRDDVDDDSDDDQREQPDRDEEEEWCGEWPLLYEDCVLCCCCYLCHGEDPGAEAATREKKKRAHTREWTEKEEMERTFILNKYIY